MRLDLEIDRCTKKVKESTRALSTAKKDAAAHGKQVADLKRDLERLQAARVRGRGCIGAGWAGWRLRVAGGGFGGVRARAGRGCACVCGEGGGVARLRAARVSSRD